MLEKFYEAKVKEIDELRALKSCGRFPEPFAGKRPDFKKNLRARDGLPAIIAEYKRASPSRGRICSDISVEEAVSQYTANGADALSILTEKVFFEGDPAYLCRAHEIQRTGPKKPVLRKDFIFDPLQVEATAASPASALLLIVKMIPDAGKLRELRELAEQFGLQCAVEIFNQEELKIARKSGASIIQVNARDLKTLKVDRRACLNLAEACPPEEGELWIAASGMDSHQHLAEAAAAGYGAALLGTALMKDGEPGKALASLLRR